MDTETIVNELLNGVGDLVRFTIPEGYTFIMQDTCKDCRCNHNDQSEPNQIGARTWLHLFSCVFEFSFSDADALDTDSIALLADREGRKRWQQQRKVLPQRFLQSTPTIKWPINHLCFTDDEPFFYKSPDPTVGAVVSVVTRDYRDDKIGRTDCSFIRFRVGKIV